MRRNSVRHKWLAAHARFPSLDDGEFHRVDIGALGTVTAKLTGELEAARKELVEQRQATQTPEQT